MMTHLHKTFLCHVIMQFQCSGRDEHAGAALPDFGQKWVRLATNETFRIF